MTDDKKLKLLITIQATEMMQRRCLRLFYDRIDNEIFLDESLRSVMELFEIPYRLTEHKGEPHIAIDINNYHYQDETNYQLGGTFTFAPNWSVFLSS
ncbi:MAG: hypothetical protein O2951_12860 [Bacteroidetes bacterium]|nr:hypothetical protein [Bacteroidota bacterium]